VKLKAGVRLAELCPQMVLAAVVVDGIYAKRGLECVITSANDSRHSAASWHYKGRALDFRTHYEALNEQEQEIRDEVKESLGQDFDVVMEAVGTPNEHLHVEYDPK
jgi:hypothetical protein